MKDRDVLLDVLKGVGIFLVVFGHTCKADVKEMVYWFHMPLFFVLSGCALSYSSCQTTVGVKKYIKSLVVPYLAFSLITFAYWAMIEWRLRPSKISPIFTGYLGEMDVRFQEFLNIFTAYATRDAFEYNVVLWFLPCLFCSLVAYKWMKLYLRHWCLAGVVALPLVYFCLKNSIPLLPWCFEISMVAIPFVWVGDRFYHKALSDKRICVVGGAISVLVILLCLSNFHPKIGMLGHNYSEWYVFYPLSLSLIFLTFCVSKFFVCFDIGVLQWMGRNSLVIMCVHEPIKRIVLKVASVFSGYDIVSLRMSIIASGVIVVVTICIIWPIERAINHYAPLLAGRTQRNI